MNTLLLFGILSIPILAVSWRTLFKIRSHGFFRFLCWECIIWLFANNYRYWFNRLWSITQLISWTLLILSAWVVIAGFIQMKKAGKAGNTREDKNLYGFEKTTVLVDSGIFRYIRHPLYASLLYLTWGIFFKNPNPMLLIISALSSVLIYITARFDEKECTAYFGKNYIEYMKRSKMFVPYVF